MNRFVDRRIWLYKSPRITDFSDIPNELADLENRTDHESRITDHLCIWAWTLDSTCVEVWILNPSGILGHRSLVS